MKTIRVSAEERILSVNATAQKESFLPGETIQYTIRTRQKRKTRARGVFARSRGRGDLRDRAGERAENRVSSMEEAEPGFDLLLLLRMGVRRRVEGHDGRRGKEKLP